MLEIIKANCLFILWFSALRPKIAASKEMEKLKDHFVMVNTEDDEEPKDKQFDQDGQYVPRIFFLGKLGF